MIIDAYSHAMPLNYREELLKMNINDHLYIPPLPLRYG